MTGEVVALVQISAVAGSQVAAGASSRRSSPVATLMVVAPVSALVVLVGLLFLGTTSSPAAVGMGAAAGTAGGGGLLLVYRALTGGSVGLVVPISTSVTTVAIALVGAWLTEAPSSLTWVGAALCVFAVYVLVHGGQGRGSGVPPERRDRPVTSLVLAAGAGLGFSAFVLLISEVPEGEGLAALMAARAAVVLCALLALTVAVRRTGGQGVPGRSAVIAGLLDGASNLLLLAALDGVSVVLVGVLSAAGPAVAALLSFVALRERLSRAQSAGISLTFVGGLLAVMG